MNRPDAFKDELKVQKSKPHTHFRNLKPLFELRIDFELQRNLQV